jgi:hypothetical protein
VGSEGGTGKGNIEALCAFCIYLAFKSVIQNGDQAYNGEYCEEEDAFFDKNKEEIGGGSELPKLCGVAEDADGPPTLSADGALSDPFDGQVEVGLFLFECLRGFERPTPVIFYDGEGLFYFLVERIFGEFRMKGLWLCHYIFWCKFDL